MAVRTVHGDADPDVQLAVAPRGRLPEQRGRRRRGHHRHDARHEPLRHLAALPLPQTHKMVNPMTMLETPTPSVAAQGTVPTTGTDQPKAEARNLNFYYGSFQALKNINLRLADKRVTALIGPSGCGKSTFLRCFNRMHDLHPGNRYEGEILIHPDDVNILAKNVDPIEVRMRISMVFQEPNPFPKSIYVTVAYGLRGRGMRNKQEIDGK